MFKKALQIAVAFSVLLGGYAGYTQLFLLATVMLSEGQSGDVTPFPEVDAKSARKATKLARESFGPDHWASQDNLKLNYIEEQRGYYFYAQNHEFKNERKQLVLTPFALVWVSVDGKSHKTATSDSAVIDMSGPMLGNPKPGEPPSHVVHAKLVGNVKFRDDKGTRDDPTDDLRVSNMDQVDYDEATLQITSDSDILLEDRNMTLTGLGMMIQLRRKETVTGPNAPAMSGGGGTGFDADTAYVYKDVHIVIKNGGSAGVLPGKPQPKKSGNNPIDTRSDGEMKIVMPPPRPPVLVGPPDLNRTPDPTFVSFRTNVRVIQGVEKVDQLNSDTLDLTLLPKPRPEPTEEDDYFEDFDVAARALLADPATLAENPPGGSSGPMTDLQLHKAIARGDAVWLQSEAQGLVARCVELIHEKHDDGTPDFTYLNGGTTKKLDVERVEYDLKSPIPGTIKSVTKMKAQDATIFDYGPGGTSRVIARGPGRADERPARNAPIQRTAYWEDEMELITWRDGEGTMPTPHVEAVRALKDPRNPVPAKGTLRRVITLTGVSKLVDHGKPKENDPGQTTTLDARKAIVAEFQSDQILDPKFDPKLDPKAEPKLVDGPNEIKWLDAYKDAHLTAPSKTLTAREFLKARFKTPPPPPPAPVTPPLLVGGPTPPPPEPKPEPAPKVEPAVDGRADRIWATLLLGSAGTKGELENAMLRGSVMVHQDPAPGKASPNEAYGEAIDLTGQGKGLLKFAVKAEEPPQASDPKTKLASRNNGRGATPSRMARIEFEGKVIESNNIIGLDQKSNSAWVDGAGVFTQLTERGFLDDKGMPGEGALKDSGSAVSTPQDKMVITWNEQMRFYGYSKDLDGRPAAKIEFRGATQEVRTPSGKAEVRRGVDAKMTESVLLSDWMDVYMDRTVDLAKDTRKGPKNPDEPVQPDPKIAMLECFGKNVYENGKLKISGVVIINEKKIPGSNDLKEKQRIEGIHVVYDKRSGEFEAPGPGTTWLYQRDTGYDLKLLPAMNDLSAIPKEGKKLMIVAPVGRSLHFRVFDPEGKPIVDADQRNLAAKPQQIEDLRRQLAGLWPPHELTPTEKGKLLPKVTAIVGLPPESARTTLPPIKLTKVKYVEGFQGRFGVARDQVDNEHREALFLGSAQAANATVLSGNGDIDFDKPAAKDYTFLTSDEIHVFTDPAAIGSKSATRQLLKARGNGVARTIDSLITADRITYDSSTELIYAYGEDDKEVSLTRQDSMGQPSSGGRGKTLRYNKVTRASNFEDPQSIVFTDLTSGFRPKPYFPELGGSAAPFQPPKPVRLPFMRTQRSSTERKLVPGN